MGPGETEGSDAQFLIDAASALHVVRAAERIGVLAALAERPREVSALARHCGLPEGRMARLLSALAALHLAHAEANLWRARVSPRVARSLLFDPDLATALRSGPAIDAATSTGAGALYASSAPLLGELMRAPAAELAQSLDGLGPEVLELGAGAMPWGLALAPPTRLTGLDLAQVVDAVRATVARRGSVEWIVGDIFTTPLPRERFDLVLVPNLLHLFRPTRNERLLRRAAELTRRGGHVAVIDIIRGPDDAPDRSRALYDACLASRTGEGRVYTSSEIRGWLEAAGLRVGASVRTRVEPHMDLLLASRPRRSRTSEPHTEESPR